MHKNHDATFFFIIRWQLGRKRTLRVRRPWRRSSTHHLGKDQKLRCFDCHWETDPKTDTRTDGRTYGVSRRDASCPNRPKLPEKTCTFQIYTYLLFFRFSHDTRSKVLPLKSRDLESFDISLSGDRHDATESARGEGGGGGSIGSTLGPPPAATIHRLDASMIAKGRKGK